MAAIKNNINHFLSVKQDKKAKTLLRFFYPRNILIKGQWSLHNWNCKIDLHKQTESSKRDAIRSRQLCSPAAGCSDCSDQRPHRALIGFLVTWSCCYWAKYWILQLHWEIRTEWGLEICQVKWVASFWKTNDKTRRSIATLLIWSPPSSRGRLASKVRILHCWVNLPALEVLSRHSQ